MRSKANKYAKKCADRGSPLSASDRARANIGWRRQNYRYNLGQK